MATYTVNGSIISGNISFNFSNIPGGAGSSALDPINMAPGDVLTVSYLALPGDPTITVGGFTSTVWTSTTSMSLYNNSASRTVKTGASLIAVTLTGSGSGVGSDFIYVQIISSSDSLPDSIAGDLGSNITNANPNQVYDFDPVTVSGVNVAVTSSVSGNGAQQRKSLNGTWQSGNMTVNNGDKVYVRGTSSTNYSTSQTFTLKIGGNVNGTLNTDYVQDAITVTTGVDPNSGTKIPFPISSGTISLLDIIEFWGGRDYVGASYVAPKDIGSYYRGGTYVPNLTSGSPNNSAIPTSGVIAFSNFYNGCTTFYFSAPPVNRSDIVDTAGNNGSGGNDVAKVVWSLQPGAGYFGGSLQTNNWAMGFGPGMTYNAEYKWEHTAGFHSSNSNITFNTPTTSTALGVFSQNNTFCEVSIETNNFTEGFYDGTLTLTARHPDYTTYTTSTTVQYVLGFFGP